MRKGETNAAMSLTVAHAQYELKRVAGNAWYLAEVFKNY